MIRGKPLCEEIRILIIDKFKSGKTYGQISTDLRIPRSTIQSIVSKYKVCGNFGNNVSNRGRTSKISLRDKRALANIIKQNRRSTIRDIALKWSEAIGKPVKREWTQLQLKSIGYNFYKAKQKPLLTAAQMKKTSVMVERETPLGTTAMGQYYLQRRIQVRYCLKRTVKFPASVMVWGCMSSKGVVQLHFIDGIVNAEKYIRILEENLIPSVSKLAECWEYIFQQDGASSHTAKKTKKWLEENGIEVLD
ncbi:uncharacterized protein LOC142225054 [Haematobia irritans]|uniref:uncharacterized protein LOC142225054 n=1 Tax=Haematobia irritans TaxID=7368 RepID=UPI003F4F9C7C